MIIKSTIYVKSQCHNNMRKRQNILARQIGKRQNSLKESTSLAPDITRKAERTGHPPLPVASMTAAIKPRSNWLMIASNESMTLFMSIHSIPYAPRSLKICSKKHRRGINGQVKMNLQLPNQADDETAWLRTSKRKPKEGAIHLCQ